MASLARLKRGCDRRDMNEHLNGCLTVCPQWLLRLSLRDTELQEGILLCTYFDVMASSGRKCSDESLFCLLLSRTDKLCFSPFHLLTVACLRSCSYSVCWLQLVGNFLTYFWSESADSLKQKLFKENVRCSEIYSLKKPKRLQKCWHLWN